MYPRTDGRQRPRQPAALQQTREGVLAALLGQQLHHLKGAVQQVVVHHQWHQLAATATGQSGQGAVAPAGAHDDFWSGLQEIQGMMGGVEE